MARRGSLPSRLAALALAIAVVAALGLGVVRPMLAENADSARRIEALRGQLARLHAAAARAAARRASQAQLGSAADQRGLLLPAASEANATARLQERFGGIIEAAGGRLSTTQVLPANGNAAARRIGLRLQFAADTKALRAILHAFEYRRPAAIVESLFIHAPSGRSVGNPLPLTVRLDIYAFLPPAKG